MQRDHFEQIMDYAIDLSQEYDEEGACYYVTQGVTHASYFYSEKATTVFYSIKEDIKKLFWDNNPFIERQFWLGPTKWHRYKLGRVLEINRTDALMLFKLYALDEKLYLKY